MFRRVALRSAAVALVLLALGAASSSAASGPSVAPTQIGLPVFVGSGFTPHAQVVVTLTTGRGTAGPRTTSQRIRANAAGRFLARFIFTAIDPCRGAVVVRAVDGHGVSARWKQPCRPPSTTAPFPSN